MNGRNRDSSPQDLYTMTLSTRIFFVCLHSESSKPYMIPNAITDKSRFKKDMYWSLIIFFLNQDSFLFQTRLPHFQD